MQLLIIFVLIGCSFGKVFFYFEICFAFDVWKIFKTLNFFQSRAIKLRSGKQTKKVMTGTWVHLDMNICIIWKMAKLIFHPELLVELRLFKENIQQRFESLDDRKLNGKLLNENLSQVSIQTSTGNHFCGGAIIGEVIAYLLFFFLS